MVLGAFSMTSLTVQTVGECLFFGKGRARFYCLIVIKGNCFCSHRFPIYCLPNHYLINDYLLEPVCCKKQQKKSPNQETGLGYKGDKGPLEALNDTKLILNN